MNLADLSIKRPVFITSLFSLILIIGGICFTRLGVDMFPSLTFPIVVVSTVYPGAGPEEIEQQVSKPIEEQVSTLSGISSTRSISKEGVSVIIAEFTYETDIKYATQQVRDRIASVRSKLPDDIMDPIIRNVSPSDLPVGVVAVSADLPPGELYDLVDSRVKPRIEQVNNVGLVDIYGARKREVHVDLDRDALKRYEVSAGMVAARIAASGKNIPAGKLVAEKETVVRSMAEFRSLKDIESTVVSFIGNDVPVLVSNVANVRDGLTEETSRTEVDGKPSIFLYVYKQSEANTVAVFDGVEATMRKLTKEFENAPGSPKLDMIRDGAKPIRMNVDDVRESIIIGIILTIVVVFLFLGNFRSTLITGIALPNSLIGAFILLYVAGFSINVLSLLGMSLAVGLLIDDAIVVRENIFRHMEMGKSPAEAASIGTREVVLAVVATTACILAVFAPVAFTPGMTGKFMREFGLTVCFAMLISLFDALTMGPMLSAYFGGVTHGKKESALYRYTFGAMLRAFDQFQEWMSVKYEGILRVAIHWPLTIIVGSILIFGGSLVLASRIPLNFMSQADMGEFIVNLDLPAGTTLDTMDKRTKEVESLIKAHKEVVTTVTTVGNPSGESNVSNIYVKMTPYRKRKVTTNEFKEILREDFKPHEDMNPKFAEALSFGGGSGDDREFALNIVGPDLEVVKDVAGRLKDQLKKSADLKDVDWSWHLGKPEYQVRLDSRKADQFGISSASVGGELRVQIEGASPAVYRDSGREYDIRVRLRDDQRSLKDDFQSFYTPNINMSLVRLADVSTLVEGQGPATINRQDRGRYIQITGDVAPHGRGLGAARQEAMTMLKNAKLPEGVHYMFKGRAEKFVEMMTGIALAALMGMAFIYLVLASLYESFITPFTIMLVFPLALSGAFVALYMGGRGFDMMALIGCVLLIGLATKNSILLVDYANQLVEEGKTRDEAMIISGRVRLRPILMTSIALVAGMLPIAIGLSEVSKARSAMGIAVIGGVISSTVLTLLVVPAVYSYIDRFRVWSLSIMKRVFSVSDVH